MNALLKGIQDELLGDTNLQAAMSGRYYFSRVKQNPTAPYIAYHIIYRSPDRTFGQKYKEFDVQFDVWSKPANGSVVESGTIQDLLEACLDDAILTVTGWTCISVDNTGGPTLKDGDWWHAITNYHIRLQKN